MYKQAKRSKMTEKEKESEEVHPIPSTPKHAPFELVTDKFYDIIRILGDDDEIDFIFNTLKEEPEIKKLLLENERPTRQWIATFLLELAEEKRPLTAEKVLSAVLTTKLKNGDMDDEDDDCTETYIDLYKKPSKDRAYKEVLNWLLDRVEKTPVTDTNDCEFLTHPTRFNTLLLDLINEIDQKIGLGNLRFILKKKSLNEGFGDVWSDTIEVIDILSYTNANGEIDPKIKSKFQLLSNEAIIPFQQFANRTNSLVFIFHLSRLFNIYKEKRKCSLNNPDDFVINSPSTCVEFNVDISAQANTVYTENKFFSKLVLHHTIHAMVHGVELLTKPHYKQSAAQAHGQNFIQLYNEYLPVGLGYNTTNILNIQ